MNFNKNLNIAYFKINKKEFLKTLFKIIQNSDNYSRIIIN